MAVKKRSPSTVPSADALPRYRSGAVARMLQMPVSTLRVWERRYGVVQPMLSPAGHRLYSAKDVRRLTQIKQLTDTGHAIGSVATLDEHALHQIASTHATALTVCRPPDGSRTPLLRVMVVGRALARRLRRPGLTERLGHGFRVAAVHDDLSEVSAVGGAPIDLLLVESPRIDASTQQALAVVRATTGARRTAMLYGFGATAHCDAIAASGVAILRESQDDRALAVWLRQMSESAAVSEKGGAPSVATTASLGDIGPRRYDDAALTDFAALSSTIVCECPRHVAELLLQLSHFEEYSADCEDRSPADAALHAYLRRVAGTARSMFETALERIAIQEGLMLPP